MQCTRHQCKNWCLPAAFHSSGINLAQQPSLAAATAESRAYGMHSHVSSILHDAGFVVHVAVQPSKPLAICAGHQGPVTQALFLPAAAASMSDSGSSPALQPSMPVPILLTAGDDWTVRLWDAAAGSCRATCVGHGGAVTAVQVASSKHSSRIISGAADGSVGVWSLRGELCRLVQQHWAPVQVLAQGDDAFVSGEHNVQLGWMCICSYAYLYAACSCIKHILAKT